ncbi:MAG: hypothetical protein FWC86_04795 [Coriobacteriia bacterium]|nr:hypothetical protein [Coriobacteriia bacterium]
MLKQSKPYISILASLILAATLLPLSHAYASDAEYTLELTPFEAINYYIARHAGAYSVAVTGFLSPEVELPAKVEIAVPAGSEIIWFSEFSGGFISNDPEFTEPFNMRTEGNLDIYTVITQYNHAIQIEYHLEDDPVTRLSPGLYSLAMEYTPVADTPILRLMTNLPAESLVQDSDVEFMGENDEGYLVFMRIYNDVPAFAAVQGEISHQPPAGQGTVLEGGSLLGGLGIAITAAVTVILAATIFIVWSSKRRAA